MSDPAVLIIANAIITVAGMWIGYLKLKNRVDEKATEVQGKVDDNTAITTEAKKAAETFSRKLNGGIDNAIEAAIGPLRASIAQLDASFREHTVQDAEAMGEIRAALNSFVSDAKMKEFSEYVHKRNHDLLEAMGTQSLKMDLVIARFEDWEANKGRQVTPEPTEQR